MPRIAPRPAAASAPAALVVPVALVLAAFLGAGCADDDAASPGDTASTTAPSATTGDPTTTGRPCPERGAPPGDAVEDAVPADVDGDGSDDDVIVTIVDDRTIALGVTFAAGGRAVAVYDDPSVATFAPVRVARVADVDADGDDDLWVVVGSGAAVEVVSLVVADGCALVRPEADGGPNTFTVGASVGFVSGVECGDLDGDGAATGFFEHVAERTGDSTYEGTSTEWFVEPDPVALRRGEAVPFSLDLESDDASPYGELTCP